MTAGRILKWTIRVIGFIIVIQQLALRRLTRESCSNQYNAYPGAQKNNSAISCLTIIVATRNQHKLGEIQAMLGSGARCISLDSLPNAPVSVESAPDFTGNAAIKAMDLARYLTSGPLNFEKIADSTKILVLADDSGLEVDALGGAPGVNSARYAAVEAGVSGNATDEANRAKLLRALKGMGAERRGARFRCALAAVIQGSLQPEIFEGVCEGSIGFEPRGNNGFGYDSVFIPTGFQQTFGELPDEIKNKLSHRAKALEQLRIQLGTLSSRDCRAT